MNNDSILKILTDVNDGEMNRYGEIEYKLSEKERFSKLEQILPFIQKNSLDENTKASLTSVIYWLLNGTSSEFEFICLNFLPLYAYLPIQNAFLNHLSENLIVSHRIQNIYLILKVIKEFNLQAKEWAEDALICLGKISKEEDSKIELLMEDLTSLI